MKKIVAILSVFFLPNFLKRIILRLLGHEIGRNVKIGFSLIHVDKLKLSEGSWIGHFNVLKNELLVLKKNSHIKHFNMIKGPFDLILESRARIANQNYITRAVHGVTYGESVFKLGENSNITSKHFIDLTKSVIMGSNTVLGGRDTQIWTHGYVHKETGDDRFRVDGEVKFGDNVYIGSRCLFNPGVTISNAISIGGGSVVSKDLINKGMYVNQSLRFLEQDFEMVKKRLVKVEGKSLIEEVYLKKNR